MPKKEKKVDPYNYVFLIVIAMCGFVLIASGISRIGRYSERISKFLPSTISIIDSKKKNDVEDVDSYTISFNEQETLAEVAKRHDISVESLCASLNIDKDTNPNIKLCELFDGCISD